MIDIVGELDGLFHLIQSVRTPCGGLATVVVALCTPNTPILVVGALVVGVGSDISRSGHQIDMIDIVVEFVGVSLIHIFSCRLTYPLAL